MIDNHGGAPLVVKKRAITDQDKQKRREKILKAAWQLYERGSVQLPTVSNIARKAGLSKGTVYLYFRTKEEIFLNLFVHLLERWFTSIAPEMERLQPPVAIEKLAEIITGHVVEHPIILKMGSIVKGVLEENTDDRVVFETKLKMATIVDSAGTILAQRLPGISHEDAARTIQSVYALISGLWQFTTIQPHILKMLDNAGANLFRMDFQKAVTDAVSRLLKGTVSSFNPEKR